ncbi:hypothetical protein [Streptomyces flavidovirens]
MALRGGFIRSVLATALKALADQTGRAVDDVPLDELAQGPAHVRDLAAAVVGE